MGGEEGDWLEDKGGGCWWEGEEGDLMEEEGGRGMCEWHGEQELSRLET